MSNDKLKDFFHKKLYNHETEIMESDWEIISERIRKKRRRNIIPLFYIYGTTGVAVALLIIMFLIKPDTADNTDIAIIPSKVNEQPAKPEKTDTTAENNQNNNSEKNNNTADINQNKQTDKNIIESINKSVEIAYNQASEYNNKLIQTENKDENVNKPVEKIEKIDYNKFTVNSIDFIINGHSNEIEKIVAKTITAETSYPIDKQETKQTNANDEWWNHLETETPNEKNKNTLTLALESGNNIGKNSVTGDFTNSGSNYNAAQIPNGSDMPTLAASPTSSIESLSTSKYTDYGSDVDMKHKHPLNFGIRIKKNISKNIIIKTGLSYSYFLSEYSHPTRKLQQQIHYVGIPLGFEFLILKKNNFNIYLSGEFAAEKGILYQYKEAAILDVSWGKFRTIESRSVRGLQFSTNTGLGVSYNFIKNTGIYVEPNVVYYIKDNNQPQSFRTEKLFNFGLNIGLKYDF